MTYKTIYMNVFPMYLQVVTSLSIDLGHGRFIVR